MFERQANFHKRFLAHKRFKKGKGELISNGIKQNEQVEQSENHIEISNSENKINSTPIKDESYKNVIKQHAVLNCPNCGSSINKNDLFCGECGFKLEGIKPIQEKVYLIEIELLLGEKLLVRGGGTKQAFLLFRISHPSIQERN